jgi:nucleoside-diphosphate-sugar epimerase
MAESERKVLVTGAFGQIGSELVPALQGKHGKDNVVAMGHSNIPSGFDGILEKADTRSKSDIERIIKEHNVGTIYHLVSLLSARGEQDPNLTWDINMNGLKDVLDLAVEYQSRIFWPSSIAAFGPTTPRDDTPQHTVLEPTTMYGVTKVAGENLCHYYFIKHGLDVRSVRYPGLISWKTPPGGGTTDYAVAVFYEGLQKGEYEFFVSPETTLPMMYMDDAIRGTIELMEASPDDVKERTSYNLAAISFTAKELEEEVRKHVPEFKATYKPDHRQAIANSWPRSIDDTKAREDWGWKHEFDLPRMAQEMVVNLRKKFGK